MSTSILKNHEHVDESEEKNEKIDTMLTYLKNAYSIVVLTGPGISTSQGIPENFHASTDTSIFVNKSNQMEVIEKAEASYAHCFLTKLESKNKISWIISENTDNLQDDSGFPINKIIQVHGNNFTEQCNHCKRVYVRNTVVHGYGLLPTGNKCEPVENCRPCRGFLLSTRINWETAYTRNDLKPLYDIIRNCDMVICIGTSLERPPFNFLVQCAIKHVDIVVSINAHETAQDENMSLFIHGEPDDVCRILNRKRRAYKIRRKLERTEQASRVVESTSTDSGICNVDDEQASSSSSTKSMDRQLINGKTAGNQDHLDTVGESIEDEDCIVIWDKKKSENSKKSDMEPVEFMFSFEGCTTPTRTEPVETLDDEARTSRSYEKTVEDVVARLLNVTNVVSTTSVTTCEVNDGASTSKNTEFQNANGSPSNSSTATTNAPFM